MKTFVIILMILVVTSTALLIYSYATYVPTESTESIAQPGITNAGLVVRTGIMLGAILIIILSHYRSLTSSKDLFS